MLSTIGTRGARIDFADTFAAIDDLLYVRGFRASAIAPDLAVARGHFGVTMATKAFESERVARMVVTHTSADPFFAGLAVVAHPKHEIDAPLLLADVRVLPSGVTNAFFDACGPTGDEFDSLFRKPLSQTLDAAVASAVRRKRVPEWLDRMSSGAGASLAAASGRGHVIGYALFRYIERWLDGVDKAGPAESSNANASAARTVCNAVRANGKATKMVSRFFGRDFAARYGAFVWNE